MMDVDGDVLIGELQDEGGNPLTAEWAEHRLIGFLLRNPAAITEIRDLLSPREFFDRSLGRVYEGLVQGDGLFTNEQAIELLGGVPIADRTGKQAVGYLIAQGADVDADTASVLAAEIFEVGERRLTEEGQTHIVGLDAWQSKMGALLFEERGDTTPDQYDYLVEDLIPEQELTIIMGPSQAGKSFVTYHLAMCIARGVPFFGRRVLQPQPVVWCAYEGGRGARGRMLAYARYFDVDGAIPFAALTQPIDLWSKDLNVDELVKEIDALCKIAFAGQRPGAVIIDTHNAATPGASEIDSEVVSKIRDRYKSIIRQLQTSLIVIGHTNALGKHRGNEQLTNNVETVITVHKKTVLKNRVPEVTKDNDKRDVRTMEIVKQREGETGKVADFVLHSVETGIKNKFGKVRTSCIVTAPNCSEQPEEGDSKPDTKGGFRLTDNEDHFFNVLWKQLHENGIPAPPELGLPRGLRVVERALVSKAFKSSSIPDDGEEESENTINSRWQRATNRLRRFGVIQYEKPNIWWTGKPILGKPATQGQRSLFDHEDDPGPPPSHFDFPETD